MIDSKILNKWSAEDISEETGEELFTVTYFVKTHEGHAAFYFMQFEDPPIVGFTKKIVEDAPGEPKILERNNKWHPLNHVSEDALGHAMMKVIFEKEDVEVK